jgi:antitoxin component YwqK of YwqJK toxin-antitoxin module
MKSIVLTFLFLLPLLAYSQSYEIYNNDTVNVRDANNKKQGLWLVFDHYKEKIIEKGTYKDGRKDGVWTAYYPSGQVKHEITFKNGKAIGPAKFYYETGLVSEEGYWNIDHWEGKYRYYHTNGQLAYDWNYNQEGKRTGEQKYYYENGSIKYDGVWNNGKTTGSLKMYNDSGVLIAERVYENGRFARSIRPQIKDTFRMPARQERQMAAFTGTGNHVIYNLNGKVEKKGFFVKGKLFNGEEYVYDDNNELKDTLIYKNGQLEKRLSANSTN